MTQSKGSIEGMETEKRISEIASTVALTRERIDKLEHQVVVAKIAGTILLALGITGGAVLGYATNKLAELTEKTTTLSAKFENWDSKVESAIAKLTEQERKASDDLQRTAAAVQQETENLLAMTADTQIGRVDAVGDKAVKEIEQLKTARLTASLKDGSLTLRVRAIEIVGANGKVVASFGRGEGDVIAKLGLNDADGNNRLTGYVTASGQPYTSFVNSAGQRVLWLGVYNDTESAFAEIYGAKEGKKIFVATEQSNGGALTLNAPSGRKVVYLGPDSNTGDGLLNVMKNDGTGTTSYGRK